MGYIELAKQEGGTVLAGGKALHPEGCEGGWFIEPTVIEGLSPVCRTNTEEIFGPVITLMPFKDEEEALAIANATEYGLAATLWTESLTRAHRMAAHLEFGIVWVNCWLLRDLRTPFGGAKSSGVGREGGCWERRGLGSHAILHRSQKCVHCVVVNVCRTFFLPLHYV